MTSQDDRNYIALAPHFTLHKIETDSFLLLSEDQSFRLRGEGYSLILPLLDGSRTCREIVENLQDRTAEQDIVALISHMQNKGYIVRVEPGADSGRLAFWSASGFIPADCERVLQGYRVAVVPLGGDGAGGPVQADELSAMLTASGFTVADYRDADVALVLCDDYLQQALADFAQTAGKLGLKWIPFKPGGISAWFGPVIGGQDDKANCYFCLSRRLAEHRPGDGMLVAGTACPRPAKALTRASLAIAFGFVVMEVTRFALRQSDTIMSSLIRWQLRDGGRDIHHVPLFDDCPAHMIGGGGSSDMLHRPVRLAAVRNHSGADGGWRALSPDEALARLEPIVSPLTGIVSQIYRASPAEGLYVYTAAQGNRISIDPRQNRTLGRPGGAAGKGLSDEQARISCLAEAVERYSAQWSGAEKTFQACWRNVRDIAPHPTDFLQFSENQYRDRGTLNRDLGMMGRIPEPFDETAIVDWTPAWSLRDDAPRWLPTRFCYFGYPGMASGDHKFCWADSNGCATGGSIEEAILQGFLEVVERDAVSIFWYNRLRVPSIAFDGLDDAYVAKMKDYYRGLGRDLWLLDLTTDLGIPVVMAVSALGGGSRIWCGIGAHLDARIAALRALTEINQTLLIDAAQDDDNSGNHHMLEDAFFHWLAEATLAGHPHMAPAKVPLRLVEHMPTRSFDTIDQAVRFCVDRMADAGFDTIVVNYSRDDIPLSSVRVVVPGLRHFWNRRAQGRLFDAPVRMGYLDRPLTEDQLNPLPFFF